jgi:hypothetical protein
VLEIITKEGDPRELFIDALMDPVFGPRAAIRLVQLRELNIPGARRALEQAVSSGTRMGDVYYALSEIYLADSRKAWELLQLSDASTRQANEIKKNVEGGAQRSGGAVPEPPMIPYNHGEGDHFRYELQSPTGTGPQVRKLTNPYFPDELRTQRAAGKVVLDIEVTDQGDVAGIYTISALPEVFATLATTAVQDWKFMPNAGKIRVVMQFIP